MPAVKPISIGIEHVQAAMNELKVAVRARIARKALAAGARPIRDRARANVPVRFGALKRKITITSDRNLGKDSTGAAATANVYIAKGYMYYHVSPKGRTSLKRRGGGGAIKVRPRNYAHLVEFGTQAHGVKGRGGAEWEHPGATAKPFMRPAYEESRGEALAAIRAVMVEEIRKEVAKAAAKGKSAGRRATA